MASGSSAGQPGWASQIDESIKKNDVAHKNYGAARPHAAHPRPSGTAGGCAACCKIYSCDGITRAPVLREFFHPPHASVPRNVQRGTSGCAG